MEEEEKGESGECVDHRWKKNFFFSCTVRTAGWIDNINKCRNRDLGSSPRLIFLFLSTRILPKHNSVQISSRITSNHYSDCFSDRDKDGDSNNIIYYLIIF